MIKKKRDTYTLILPKEEKKKIAVMAAKEGKLMSVYIREIIYNHIIEKERDERP